MIVQALYNIIIQSFYIMCSIKIYAMVAGKVKKYRIIWSVISLTYSSLIAIYNSLNMFYVLTLKVVTYSICNLYYN